MDNETRRGDDPGRETPAAEGTAAADLEKQAAAGTAPADPEKQAAAGTSPADPEKQAAEWDDLKKELQGALGDLASIAKIGRGTRKRPPKRELKGDFVAREAIKAVQEKIASYNQMLEDTAKAFKGIDIESLDKLFSEIDRLEPYMTAIMKNNPDYEGKTVDDILREYSLADVRDMEPGDPLFDLLEEAKRAEKEDKPPQATIKGTNKIDMPIDKVNNHVWKLLADTDTSGQIAFDVARRGDEYLPVLYSINFDELKENSIKITKRLTPFDKRVYTSIAALYNAGNDIVSLTQIYKHMGNSGRPNTKNLEKISGSITKMTAARIMVSNKKEAEKYNYKDLSYTGSLLPLEAGEAYNIKGALTEAAIHLFREPPLVSFARKRKQITTVSLKLLQSPINKTDSNIMIDDYLIEIISLAKNKHLKSVETKYEKLYTHLQTNTTMQKKRLPEKISRYLDHYKTCNYITGYEFSSDRLTIYI